MLRMEIIIALLAEMAPPLWAAMIKYAHLFIWLPHDSFPQIKNPVKNK